MTRRNLLIGAGALAGLAVAGGGISYAMNAMDQGSETTVEHIAVPADAVVDQGSYALVKATDHVKLAGSYKLPYGTLVWADNDTLAACLVPTEKASPLTTVSVLNLSSGNTTTILKKAQGCDEGFEILDVRCSEKGLVWTEANAYTSAWRVYTAKLSDGSASKITKVDEADGAWCIPSLAAVEDSAFWQVSPKADGAAAKSPSALKAARFGSDAVEVPWTTKHAFATRLVAADDGVVIAPRAESTTTYYQITKIAASNRSTVDQMTLPSSMTPDFVSYGRSGFSFGFSSIYNYGGGIANLGTYTPRAAATPFQYNGLQWFRFSRTPWPPLAGAASGSSSNRRRPCAASTSQADRTSRFPYRAEPMTTVSISFQAEPDRRSWGFRRSPLPIRPTKRRATRSYASSPPSRIPSDRLSPHKLKPVLSDELNEHRHLLEKRKRPARNNVQAAFP